MDSRSASSRPACAAVGNDPIDDVFQLAQGAPETAICGQRQRRLKLRRPERLADAPIDDRPRAVDDFCGRAEIGAEHRPDNDGLRQRHHFRDEVDRFAARRKAVPSLQHLLRAGHHGIGHRHQSLTMECGLRESPLPQPERVLARQQAVAEIVPQPIVEWALVVVAGVVLEDMFDARGIGHKESLIRAGLHMDDVAIPIRGIEKRADGIRPEVREHANERVSARARGSPDASEWRMWGS